MKWENAEKLYLNFKYNETFYRTNAPIVPESISADGTKASFTVTIPTEIPEGATFDLYGVYQKESTWDENNGGYFEKGENNNVYICENREEECITLDKMGSTQTGIARPVLTFKQTGITASTIAPIALEHRGWMMALHFKNISGAEINLPEYINFEYATEPTASFIYNGFIGRQEVKIDFDNGTISNTNSYEGTMRCVWFATEKYSWLPLYGQKLGAGETVVLYRWLISTSDIAKMHALIFYPGAATYTTISPDGKFLPAKTVENGKVYHTYMTWDGTHLKITDSAFNPLP